MIDSLLAHLKKKMKVNREFTQESTADFEPDAWRKEVEAKTGRINSRSSAAINTSEICSRPLQCTPLGMHWRHDWWQERHQEARERRVKQGISFRQLCNKKLHERHFLARFRQNCLEIKWIQTESLDFLRNEFRFWTDDDFEEWGWLLPLAHRV